MERKRWRERKKGRECWARADGAALPPDVFEGATLTWNLATDVLITHTDTHTLFFSYTCFSCAFSVTQTTR